MTKLLHKLLLGGLGAGLFLACSADSVDEQILSANATTSQVQVQDITMNHLVGTWKMKTMTSIGKAVDFDKDGNFTYDLLEETTCFRPMFFTFDAEGNVETEQARLFFDAANGKFSCQTTGAYKATYQVFENELEVTFRVDDLEYTETKDITRYSEDGSEYLKITLLKSEVSTAVYVANDPGTTVASEIERIDIVYIKE